MIQNEVDTKVPVIVCCGDLHVFGIGRELPRCEGRRQGQRDLGGGGEGL